MHQFPQQNQFIPTFSNQNQPIPPLVGQENYYQSLNGNDNRGGSINQHNSSARETPRTAPPVREPTPKQPEPYAQFNNYSHNQQFATPPQPSSIRPTYSGSIDQSQWPTEQHSQNLPYSSNQISNQKQQTHQIPPSQPASANNYNLGSTDQQNVSFNNWQNQVENSAPNFWHESSSTKPEHFSNNMNNSFSQSVCVLFMNR